VHPIVKLAKETIEKYISQKAGVFVSIKKGGELRGCIGTYSPTAENVAAEIIRNAISAATMDPRFSPVNPSELALADLEYSVDILTPPERVESPEDLDPKKYGVIVKKGTLRGLLLPDLEGVNTVHEQLRIVALKAGLPTPDGVELYRFEVRRYR
jgi:AmmeMemoRadiSam system protein A